jgi:hypothetical protein
MPSKEHLKIEDWVESRKTLCPIVVRSEGRVDLAEDGVTRCVFGNAGVGSGLFSPDNLSKYSKVPFFLTIYRHATRLHLVDYGYKDL